jgi:hypothetical protein
MWTLWASPQFWGISYQLPVFQLPVVVALIVEM